MNIPDNDPNIFSEQLRSLLHVLSDPQMANALPGNVKESLMYLAADLATRLDDCLTSLEFKTS